MIKLNLARHTVRLFDVSYGFQIPGERFLSDFAQDIELQEGFPLVYGRTYSRAKSDHIFSILIEHVAENGFYVHYSFMADTDPDEEMPRIPQGAPDPTGILDQLAEYVSEPVELNIAANFILPTSSFISNMLLPIRFAEDQNGEILEIRGLRLVNLTEISDEVKIKYHIVIDQLEDTKLSHAIRFIYLSTISEKVLSDAFNLAVDISEKHASKRIE